MITVLVNGSAHTFAPALPLSAMLDEMGLAGKRLAVELNGEIVPRSEFAHRLLGDQDQLEIVVAVGGG